MTARNRRRSRSARCLEAGLTESPLMPLDESVAIMGALDTIAADLADRLSASIPAN